MLVRLFGSNFRSLKGKFELSMVAADLKRKEDCDRGTIEVPLAGLDEQLRLLRCVAIYGANASGKSTVLSAARALRWIGTGFDRALESDSKIPTYEPFLLDHESSTGPIELGCDVVCDKSLLRYAIRFNATTIESETLAILNEPGEVKLIDRHPSGEVGGELISRSDANQLYVKEMQPNITVLSKLAQFGPHRGKESVQPYYRAIRSATRFEDYSTAAEPVGLGASNERFAQDSEYRGWIMKHLIQPADVGINGVELRSKRVGSGFKHQLSFYHDGTVSRTIDLSQESYGTKKLLNVSADWWALAKEPETLLADELSASLHPRLLDHLIRAVNDPPTDNVRSQLIFTTHDTGLLESHDGQPPALRRDQVYFTKKDGMGATELYSLAEFKEGARPVHNIRKRYMSGLYGAIPSVEKLSL